MKKINVFIMALFLLAAAGQGYAQTTNTQQAATKSFGQSLGLFVFPAKNQDKKTQDADEMACYKWAQQQTGVDPMNPPKVEAKKAHRGPNGSMIIGGARGAAAGAAIGAITGDAGKGAAIGAVAGGLRGIRARRVGSRMEQAANNQAAAAQEKQLMDNFKKAFSACMEAKGYTIK
jgi:hypothetical protein